MMNSSSGSTKNKPPKDTALPVSVAIANDSASSISSSGSMAPPLLSRSGNKSWMKSKALALVLVLFIQGMTLNHTLFSGYNPRSLFSMTSISVDSLQSNNSTNPNSSLLRTGASNRTWAGARKAVSLVLKEDEDEDFVSTVAPTQAGTSDSTDSTDSDTTDANEAPTSPETDAPTETPVASISTPISLPTEAPSLSPSSSSTVNSHPTATASNAASKSTAAAKPSSGNSSSKVKPLLAPTAPTAASNSSIAAKLISPPKQPATLSDTVPAAVATSTAAVEPPGLQMEIMVPLFNRDERLKNFAEKFAIAMNKYRDSLHNGGLISNMNINTTQTNLRQLRRRLYSDTDNKDQDIPIITTFRFLLARYGAEEQASAPALQKELAKITGLPLENIVMFYAPLSETFSRSRAFNLLHSNACPLETCMAAGLDVDIEIGPVFFNNSIRTVILQQKPPTGKAYHPPKESKIRRNTTAYFPIMWSLFNPRSVQLVQNRFQTRQNDPNYVLPRFSEHRGHWRDYSKGMYVLRGSDAAHLLYDTSFEGWGGEDVDFYLSILRDGHVVYRQNEPGLLHIWHEKYCNYGEEIFNEKNYRNCLASKQRHEGSKLGQKLLFEWQEREDERIKKRKERQQNKRKREEKQKTIGTASKAQS